MPWLGKKIAHFLKKKEKKNWSLFDHCIATTLS